MLPMLLAASTFISTALGGIFALRHKDRLHRILGFTAGILIGVVAFDLLPEIFELVQKHGANARHAMIALVCGYLTFHVIEKSILIHHSQEDEYGNHHHPAVGLLSASALAMHSFFDGLAIGLGFQAGNSVGIAVAIAVIAHDFSDGINTVSLMLLNRNDRRRALTLLTIDALAPILGAASTLLFQVSDHALVIYLGFFAGFLLYIGSSEILPEAHSQHSSYRTIALTVLGAAVMFVITSLET
ncbi:MAG: permease [Candidatus Saccharibacteria bacterium]|nr:permease [Candidatus Saccharibacteria bacterium]